MLPAIKKSVEKFLKDETGSISKKNILRVGALVAIGSLIAKPALGYYYVNAIADDVGDKDCDKTGGCIVKDDWKVCDSTFCTATNAACLPHEDGSLGKHLHCDHGNGAGQGYMADGGKIGKLQIDTYRGSIVKPNLYCGYGPTTDRMSHGNKVDCFLDTGVTDDSHSNEISLTSKSEQITAQHAHKIVTGSKVVVEIGGGKFWQEIVGEDCHCNRS